MTNRGGSPPRFPWFLTVELCHSLGLRCARIVLYQTVTTYANPRRYAAKQAAPGWPEVGSRFMARMRRLLGPTF